MLNANEPDIRVARNFGTPIFGRSPQLMMTTTTMMMMEENMVSIVTHAQHSTHTHTV